MGDQLHQVVIIGGGFGGLSAARALAGLPVKVTLIDKRNFHLFQPLLYQVATGLLCPSEVATPLRHVLKHQKNVAVLLGEAVDIDTAGRRVILADGEVHYDTLILSAGMVTHYYGHDEWEKHAPGLKTLEDTVRIRQRIFTAYEVAERERDPEKRKEWQTFVVIGSGATGIELSGMISEIAHNTLKGEFRSIQPEVSRIILLDAADRILPTYPEALSKITEKALKRLGVETRPHTMVVDIDAQGVTVEVPQGRERIPARTIVWASGVKASPLARMIAEKTGAETDGTGRVVVNPDLTIAGSSNIFVIGDMAHVKSKKGTPLPGLAPAAAQQGRYVAKAIKERLAGREQTRSFSYFDKGTMAVIGRNAAVADIGRWHFGGLLAWLSWLFIHLVLLVQFQNKVIVLIRWAFQYFSYNRGARNLMLKGKLKLPLSGKDSL
jgi:NADH dehydrogenase